jgi:hypothetical protein
MNAVQIRQWLLNKPRPVVLRVRSGKEINEVPVAGQSWARIAGTIEAMQPDLIEGLDDAGKLLRACRPADFDEDDEQEATPAPVVGPPPSAYDAETVRFELVAKLLADAHKHSAVAFDKLVQIAEVGMRRAEAVEKTMSHMLRIRQQELEERVEEAEEKAAEADGNPLAEMAKAFLGGQQHAAAAPAPPTNGKGKA